MTEDQKAVFIQSQIACAMIACMGMQAENQNRIQQGKSVAYCDKDFFALKTEYGISHNDVLNYFYQ